LLPEVEAALGVTLSRCVSTRDMGRSRSKVAALMRSLDNRLDMARQSFAVAGKAHAQMQKHVVA